MRGKLMLVSGLVTGYVLGSRAGRARYEQIAKSAGKFWHSRAVQNQVSKVEGFARAKAPYLVDFVTGRVKSAVSKPSRSRRASGSANATL